MPKLMELKGYGFERVGAWSLSDNYKYGVTFRIQQFHDKKATYAFVVGQGVKYIGSYQKNSKTILETRMKYYRTTNKGGTSTKNRERIRACLADGKAVHIYALYPATQARFLPSSGRNLADIERFLIKRLEPNWNDRHKSN
ncbi:MAG: hypothetical protein EXR47_07215 [Dehalococcoidia bacterium]|nr:hypothetical protein [Dehalococcoidia bacterium]